MYDPCTLAFEIPNPIPQRDQRGWRKGWRRWFSRPPLFVIWHVNPRGDEGWP